MIYQKKKKTIKLITLVFGFFIIFFSLLAGRGAYSTHASASADNENIKFDTTNVLDDLRGMTIDGKAFTLEDYPKDDDGSVKLISLAEYCYSYYGDMQQNYGLYVYVYNPQQMTFDCKSDKNKLQMRVGGKDTDDYTKYSLQFLDGTLLDGLENRFYKFKINFTSAQRQAVLSALNAESRIYEVSGIELLNNKSDDYPNATEYPCGFFNKETGVYSAPKYVYSGYSKGYGQTSSEETLDCTISDVEAIQLETHHTVYRPHGTAYTEPSYKTGIRDSIASVYFAVPKNLCNGYDTLDAIHATWLPVETAPILATGNKTIYDAILPYVGDFVYQSPRKFPYYLRNSSESINNWGEMVGPGYRPNNPTSTIWYNSCAPHGMEIYDIDLQPSPNVGEKPINEPLVGAKLYNPVGYEYGLNQHIYDPCGDQRVVIQLNYLFYADGGFDSADRYVVSSNELYNWIKNTYGKVTGGTTTDYIQNGKVYFEPQNQAVFPNTDYSDQLISGGGLLRDTRYLNQLPAGHGNGYYASLFDSVAEKYEDKTIEATKEYALTSYEWAEKNWFLWWNKIEADDGTERKFSAVQEVTEADLYGSKEEVCERLLISERDYDDFKGYLLANKDTKRIYLFRFDQSEYISSEMCEYDADHNKIDTNAYMCKERAYLDFDIIDVKVTKDGVQHTIACVMSPIDIFPELIPPYWTNSDLPAWWTYALIIQASALGVFFVERFVKWLRR